MLEDSIICVQFFYFSLTTPIQPQNTLMHAYACTHNDKDVCVSGVLGVNCTVIQQHLKTRKPADAGTLATDGAFT